MTLIHASERMKKKLKSPGMDSRQIGVVMGIMKGTINKEFKKDEKVYEKEDLRI